MRRTGFDPAPGRPDLMLQWQGSNDLAHLNQMAASASCSHPSIFTGARFWIAAEWLHSVAARV
jgi:hypothetical protein